MSEYTKFEARIRCMVSGSEIVQWSSLSKGDREAITWAIVEIDRLRAELEEHKTAAEYYAAALGMCEAKLTHALDQLSKVEPVKPMLCWMTEKPTEPGWYWLRGGWADPATMVYVEIYPNLGKNRVIINLGDSLPPTPPNAEWWGPVPEPTPPQEEK